MERLTFEGDFCDIAMCLETRGGSFCEEGACSQRRVWERLKYYEDLEEQGRLLVLPCKVGEICWGIGQPCGTCEGTNEVLTQELIERCASCQKKEVIPLIFDYELIPELGETVFSTREEAEAALKGGAN